VDRGVGRGGGRLDFDEVWPFSRTTKPRDSRALEFGGQGRGGVTVLLWKRVSIRPFPSLQGTSEIHRDTTLLSAKYSIASRLYSAENGGENVQTPTRRDGLGDFEEPDNLWSEHDSWVGERRMPTVHRDFESD